MNITYDPAKNERNLAERVNWASAWIVEDTRRDYGEPRYLVHGEIEERLYVLVFTPRGEETVHVISLRKANRREVQRHEQQARP